MNDQEKAFKYLTSVEKLTDEILDVKNKIVALYKRRNENREALRGLKRSSSETCLFTFGSNVLIEQDMELSKSLVEDEQKQLDIDINKLRSDLKIKENNLRDLKMQPMDPGQMLVPMSQKEIIALMNSRLIQ